MDGEESEDVQTGEDGVTKIVVGPKLSQNMREWINCNVDTDPSLQGVNSFQDVPRVNWNGTERQTTVYNRRAIDYFFKAFPIQYLETIEEYTNKKLRTIYVNKNPSILGTNELLHVLDIRLAMALDPKKGGTKYSLG